MKKTYIPFIACTLLAAPAQAELSAYDGFNYTPDEVVVGKSGGSGFSAAWVDEGTNGTGYVVKTGGLAFSDLSVTGGRVEVQTNGDWTDSSRIGRNLTVGLSGQTYGSFLFRLESPFVSNYWEVAGLLIGAPGEDNNDHTAGVYPSEWLQPVGARLESTMGPSNGASLTQGTTFLVLFSSNLTNGSQALRMWVLTSSQFDNFKTGGLTEAELNGASVGSGSSNVWAKTNVSGTDPTLDGTGNLKFMTFGGNDGMLASYDELRLSKTSLADVVPVVGPPTPPAALVINEYMADNVGGIEDEDRDSPDWIELYNGTSAAVNLDGYYLTDGATNLMKWRFPAVTINSGQYLLVWASGKNRRIAGQPLHTNFKLDADGEGLALVEPDGTTVVHRFNTPLAYTPGATFPHYPSETNVSFGLHHAGTQTAFFAVPTPGQANVAPVEARGALISQLSFLPLAPTAGQAINVTARIRPDQTTATPNTITSATLHYRLMYGAEQTAPMHDDGLNGDAAAGDGFFIGTIPAALGATAGQMVRWNVSAVTSEGRTTRAPRRLISESPEYLGTVIVDPGITSPLPVIHRFVENAAAAELSTGTRCEIFYNGGFYDNCFTRIRGGTAVYWPKKSYKVEFNKGHEFLLRATQDRVDEFDLNATYTDKSYVRAQLVSEMYQTTGLPTPEIFPIHFRQNGAFYSVALYVEQPDGDFLDRCGLDPDGSYYKAGADRGACNFTTASTYEKKTRLDEGYADLEALVAAMGLTGTALETWLFDNLDLPQVVNFMAGVAITQNIDASDKNYYMHRDTDGSREWMFIPWDLDLSLGPDALNTDTIVYAQNSPAIPACASHPFIGARPWELASDKYNRLQEAIVANPRTRAMLVRRIREMNDQFLATGWFQNRMDVLKPTLQADVDADHAKWGSNSHFNWSGGGIVTLTQAMNRIKNEYLIPRVSYLTTTHAAPETLNFSTGLGRAGIPTSQPVAPAIIFGDIEINPASGIQDQEYIELRNTGTASVDLSGWTLSGGITFSFKGGTVVLPGESIYVTPNRYAFRQRTTSPRGAQRLLVTGDASGHLSNLGESLTLKNVAGTTIASITLPAAPSPAQMHLRITELHYNPPGDGLAEFIELQNTSTTVTLDLTGVHFSEGVDFAFSESTLAPGERILVVRNTAAFIAAFGAGLRIAGEFDNDTKLSDGGESVVLDDANNSTIQKVTYDDTAPWPVLADGAGAALHFIVGSTEEPGVSESARWFALAPNPDSVPDDADGDGHSNHTEWLAGTDAADATSRFMISSIVKDGDGSIVGSFQGIAGRTYRVFTSPDLTTWTPLGASIAPAASGIQTFSDVTPGSDTRFYKIATPAP